MDKRNFILFLIPAIIWGGTWFVIKFQLGNVDPLVSVSYRFGLSGFLLLVYCLAIRSSLKFDLTSHLLMALQGTLLFGLNYWLVYVSETYLTSGLVAVAFSTLIFMNIFFNAVLLGNSINKRLILSALLGFGGTALIFQPELSGFSYEDDTFIGLIFCLSGVLLASLGNITSSFNQKKGLPVLQGNAFGMLYGSIIMFLIALATDKPISFDTSDSYLLSLAYLVLFGSIVAFGSYLTLIGKIGADKAAYVIVAVPVIALAISVTFENYEPTINAFLGIVLILAGNILALRKKRV